MSPVTAIYLSFFRPPLVPFVLMAVLLASRPANRLQLVVHGITSLLVIVYLARVANWSLHRSVGAQADALDIVGLDAFGLRARGI